MIGHRGTLLLDDLVQPFQIESMAAQGRFVRLGKSVDNVLTAHDYPDSVAALLGEAQALAGLLAGAFKYDGVLTVQVKGDGPVTLLVADVTSDGAMRGYAQYDAARIRALEASGPDAVGAAPVARLLGSGYLAFTVDRGAEHQRYQGIVELEGATLADCAHAYLHRSVQMDAAINLAVGRVPAGPGGETWRAGGLMVQRMADGGRLQRRSGEARDPLDDDAWRRAVVLMKSCSRDELLDQRLNPDDLLFRLFHEDGVRVFEPSSVEMRCRCSRARVENVLRSFPRAEIESMKEDDRIVVTCEFCNAEYGFDDDQLERLYRD
jgi:molecular chaperone Hsp33